MTYQSYRDVRGNEAKPLSTAMGIDEPSGIAHTGYLVEIREAQDHIRLSAHAATYFKEVLIYNDRRLEEISVDKVAEKARKTSYSPDGVISTSEAPWSYRTNGYGGGIRRLKESKVRQI